MKIPIYDLQNNKTGEIELPKAFSEPVNDDLIRSSVTLLSLAKKHPYGSDPRAGKKSAAKLSRRRRKFKTSYGIGISRVPRKIISRSGTRFNWIGAFAPGTVGGRRAHPPKSFKIINTKMNKKEKAKAFRSALSATMMRSLVEANGHKLPSTYPFALDSSFESISKTKEAIKALFALGLESELERSSSKKIRPGKGKMRGRKYRRVRGLLIVASEKTNLSKALSNIPGVESVVVSSLSITDLAPAAKGGRFTIFTKPALESISKRIA